MSIVAQALCVDRGGHRIVSDADASVTCGSLTALVGPNGAGKSTLLRAMAGEFKPAHGTVNIDDEPLDTLDAAELARRRGVMAQSVSVVFDFSVAEILDLGWIRHFRRREEQQVAMREIIADCRIGHLLDRTFNTLSGGEQQRVQFARALLQVWQRNGSTDSRYLFLDEPTSNLDIAHELSIMRLAQDRARAGAGVLAVLHDLNLAARFCDEIIVMFDGRVAAVGEPGLVFDEELLSDVYGTPIRVEWHDHIERIVVHS
ncbi:MAG: heme ABC transporter ATP-binding protein [Pseudomonadota bacterium]